MIKALIPAVVFASALATAPAFAQSTYQTAQAGQWAQPSGQQSMQKTRAQVYQELVEARQNGQMDHLNATVYKGA